MMCITAGPFSLVAGCGLSLVEMRAHGRPKGGVPEEMLLVMKSYLKFGPTI